MSELSALLTASESPIHTFLTHKSFLNISIYTLSFLSPYDLLHRLALVNSRWFGRIHESPYVDRFVWKEKFLLTLNEESEKEWNKVDHLFTYLTLFKTAYIFSKRSQESVDYLSEALISFYDDVYNETLLQNKSLLNTSHGNMFDEMGKHGNFPEYQRLMHILKIFGKFAGEGDFDCSTLFEVKYLERFQRVFFYHIDCNLSLADKFYQFFHDTETACAEMLEVYPEFEQFDVNALLELRKVKQSTPAPITVMALTTETNYAPALLEYEDMSAVGKNLRDSVANYTQSILSQSSASKLTWYYSPIMPQTVVIISAMHGRKQVTFTALQLSAFLQLVSNHKSSGTLVKVPESVLVSTIEPAHQREFLAALLQLKRPVHGQQHSIVSKEGNCYFVNTSFFSGGYNIDTIDYSAIADTVPRSIESNEATLDELETELVNDFTVASHQVFIVGRISFK